MTRVLLIGRQSVIRSKASPSLAAQFPHRNAHDHAALSKWVTKRRATRGSEGSQPRSALTP